MILGHSRIGPGSTGHEAGRKLLRELYLAHAGSPMPPIRLADRGKPYFEGDPVYFSITHTKNHVFCALSDRPIGIDAEETDRDIDLRLAEKILSPEEKAQWDTCADKRLGLLRFWVLKEAHAKLCGRGWGSYLSETNFDLNDPRISHQDGCLLAVIQEETHAV